MNYKIDPKYQIENAINQINKKTEKRNQRNGTDRIIRIKPNPIKIIYKKQSIIRPTENQRIKKLEYKIYRIETLLKHQLKNIESILSKIQ